MTASKNQLIAKLARQYKSDEITLIDTCNYLQKLYPEWEILKESYLIFNEDGYLESVEHTVMQGEKRHFRNPDIIMILNNRVIIIELDGFIHVKKTTKTWERNHEYFTAALDYIAVSEEDLKFLKIDPLVYITEELNKLI